MDNARYAPPLSEWGRNASTMYAKLIDDDGKTHACTVTRQQRAEYEERMREDAEWLRRLGDQFREFSTAARLTQEGLGRIRRIADTLEGTMQGKAGDWLVTGLKGEQYPVDDEIFRATYEPTEEKS